MAVLALVLVPFRHLCPKMSAAAEQVMWPIQAGIARFSTIVYLMGPSQLALAQELTSSMKPLNAARCHMMSIVPD